MEKLLVAKIFCSAGIHGRRTELSSSSQSSIDETRINAAKHEEFAIFTTSSRERSNKSTKKDKTHDNYSGLLASLKGTSTLTMSSTRNNKRKRPPTSKDDEGGAAASSSVRVRRSRVDQRAQASTSTSPDPEKDGESSSGEQEESVGDYNPSETKGRTSANNEADTSDVSPVKELEEDRPKHSHRKEGNTDKDSIDDPKNRSEHSSNVGHTNGMIGHGDPADKNATNLPQTTRSLRSSPVPTDGETSSQGDGSDRRVPLHVATAINALPVEDRETRLKDLISHRALLLHRVRKCRESAERRLGEPSSKESSKKDRTSGEGVTEEEEIAAFRELTKKANQASKRSRVDGEASAPSGTDKRMSFSLRRGSTVGKKMNAALSSLAPGSSAAATTSSTAAAAAAAAAALKTTTTPVSSVSANVPLTITGANSRSVSPKFGGTLASSSNSNFPSNQHSAFNASMASSTTNGPQSRGRGSASKAPRTSSSLQAGTSSNNRNEMPHQAMGQNQFSSPNRTSKQPMTQVQRVFFPEAAALRDERERIRGKLRALLERQQLNEYIIPGGIRRVGSRDEEIRTKSSGKMTISPGRNIGNNSQQQQLQNKANQQKRRRPTGGLEIQSQAPMPERRRTHWDTVLQEMSWLAADFIQERQWKVSSSRLVSSKVSEHRLLRRQASPSDIATNKHSSKRSSSQNMKQDESELTEDPNRKKSNSSHKPTQRRATEKKKYKIPSDTDKSSCQTRGKVISTMISGLNGAIQTNGVIVATEKYHQGALKQFMKVRREYCDELGQMSFDELEEMAVDADSMKKRIGPIKELTLDSITERIEQLQKVGKTKHKSTAREYANALKSNQKINLHATQKNMVDFVEKFWGEEPSFGVVLSGPVSSGKTFCAATLLWKNRLNGPQLLICPSWSVIRWKLELEKFSNVTVFLFGSKEGITSLGVGSDTISLKSTDVAICTYDDLVFVEKMVTQRGIDLYSVVVDFRHPVALSSHNEKGAFEHEGFPPHYSSSSWWDSLMNLCEVNTVRRLFIDYNARDPFGVSKSHMEARDQLVFLANRAACLIGLETFRSKMNSIHRRVLTWARHVGKSKIADKMKRVRDSLYEAVSPLSFESQKELVDRTDIKWDVRSCPMTPAQRHEYERCCYEVRGALSSDLSGCSPSKSSEMLRAASNALFRLRQSCFHPRSSEILSNLIRKPAENAGAGNRGNLSLDWLNSSQPDAATIETLLEGSSKLKELVSICLENGHKFASEKSLHRVVSRNLTWSDVSDEEAKKIVILASQPELRILVSLLLRGLGIPNTLLSRQFSPDSSNTDAREDLFSWCVDQLALSSFCDEEHVQETGVTPYENINIVISSPFLFGNDAGVGVEGAEMILVLDSDWSGRDRYVYDALINRWLTSSTFRERDVQLIRLVCDKSVEHCIFDPASSAGSTSSWPVRPNGCLAIPKSFAKWTELVDNTLNKEHISTLPGSRLLEERGELLYDVLATSATIPPILGTGEEVRFLPWAAGKDFHDDKIFAFVQEIFESEVISDFRHSLGYPKIQTTPAEPSSKVDCCDASLRQFDAPSLFVRRDLVAIQSFLYLERLVRSHSSIKIPGEDGAPILLSQLSESVVVDYSESKGSSVAKVDDNPATFLMYESKLPPTFKNDNHTNRVNVYAKTFSLLSDGLAVSDGKQGKEALVFFPPLFPLLQDSARRARYEYLSSPSLFENQEPHSERPGKQTIPFGDHSNVKRKSEEAEIDETQQDEKRPKIEAPRTPESKARDSNESSKVTPPHSAGSSHGDQPTGDHSSEAQAINSLILSPMEEDFGLLGGGAVARPVEAASFSSYDSVRTNGYFPATDKYDFLSFPIPCDAEETIAEKSSSVDQNIGDMILFVNKKQRSLIEYPGYDASRLHYSPRNTDITGGTSQPFTSLQHVGEDSILKGKRRNLTDMITAFSPVAGGTSIPPARANVLNTVGSHRKDFRHVALATYLGREKTTGLSMFDSILYRVSAMRVERRVAERLEQWMWKSTMSYDSGPGIPIGLQSDPSVVGQRFWLNHANKLSPGSETGDAARAMSRSQRDSLMRSKVSPIRVDFGPFESGFLACPSGMTSIPTSRQRVGVSLPMGVKISRSHHEDGRSKDWPALDDKVLRESVAKYGKNWLLISSIFNNRDVPRSQLSARSALDCRDHWNSLKRENPNPLEKKVRSIEGQVDGQVSCNGQKETDTFVVRSKLDVNILIRTSFVQDGAEHKQGEDENKDETSGESQKETKYTSSESPPNEALIQKKKRFSAVATAKTKKHVVPITIPGVVSGQPPNQPVPSHPSHIQAVQTSVTAQWAQGRTEMWPLQILDLADKQRSATLQRGSNGSSPSVARRPHQGPSGPPTHRSSSSRHPAGRPHHGPFPTPPNAVRPVPQSRGPPPPSNPAHSSSQRLAPQHHHAPPHSHVQHHHRSPPGQSNPAQAYAQTHSTPAAGRPVPSNRNSNVSEVPIPPPGAPPPAAASLPPSGVPTANATTGTVPPSGTPVPPPATPTQVALSNPDKAPKKT